KGVPSMVQRTLIRPPSSRLGPLTDAERARLIALSPLAGQYDDMVDRESAYEILKARAEESARALERKAEIEAAWAGAERGPGRWTLPDFEKTGRNDGEARTRPAPRRTSQRQTVTEAAIKSVARSVGSSIGRALVRGILGSLRK